MVSLESDSAVMESRGIGCGCVVSSRFDDRYRIGYDVVCDGSRATLWPPGCRFPLVPTPQGANNRSHQGTKGQTNAHSPNILPLSKAGMRDTEIHNLSWAQIDFDKRLLVAGAPKPPQAKVGPSPSTPPTLRATRSLPMYTERFGTIRPEWFVFPAKSVSLQRVASAARSSHAKCFR